MSVSAAWPYLLRRPSPTRSLRCLSASPKTERITTTKANKNIMNENAKETIREMFNKIEVSMSAYDTAWVAMVPSLDAPGTPCYPATLKWISENQLHDGSWRLPHQHAVAVPIKDIISATLACVLALKTWQVGQQQITKGLDFIRSNFAKVMDDSVYSPIGFDIVFPSMIDSATEMALNLHIDQTDLEALSSKKDMLLKSIRAKNSEAENAYLLAYVSEGLGKLQDWEMVMKYQRKNGSVLNSPATTAAALSHLRDPNCRTYIDIIVQRFGNAVPAVYPFDIFARLCLVDKLQNLGIDRHFTANVTHVLDQLIRLWMQGDEEIFADIATCAMAFRLLRSHGYNVSSEPLVAYGREGFCFNQFGGHLKDINDALEVFKASQMIIHPSESFLDEHNLCCKDYLRQMLSDQSMIHSDQFLKNITQEVQDALASPYSSSLERVAVRQYIEHYNLDDTKLLKTAYCFKNFSNEVLLGLAVEDFNLCQSIYHEEMRQLKRWAMENRLDQLTYCRQKLGYCYFSAAVTMFAPVLADARLCWAKNAVLITVFDDFFDVGSSVEEQDNLIKLVEEWNGKDTIDCCSENVKILFTALRITIGEIADGAYSWQDRNVMDHIIELWLAVIKSMWRESEMTRNEAMPTFKDYMANGLVSLGMGPIVLATLYLVVPNLSNEVVRSDEYDKLYKLLSTSGRLLNDVQGLEREAAQGKVNAVSVYMHHHQDEGISNEEVILQLMLMAEDKRRQLVGLVFKDKDSVVPRACKEVILNMCKVLKRFCMDTDEFTRSDMEHLVKSVIQDPIVLN